MPSELERISYDCCRVSTPQGVFSSTLLSLTELSIILHSCTARVICRGEAGQEGEKPGVMDTLAESVGMKGRFITIPGALGVPEKRVHLLYLPICAIAVSFPACNCSTFLDRRTLCPPGMCNFFTFRAVVLMRAVCTAFCLSSIQHARSHHVLTRCAAAPRPPSPHYM